MRSCRRRFLSVIGGRPWNARSHGGLTGGGRKHSLSRHRLVCGMECAVPRHSAPAGGHPGRQLSFRPFCGRGSSVEWGGQALPHHVRGGLCSTEFQPGSGQQDSAQARIPTR